MPPGRCKLRYAVNMERTNGTDATGSDVAAARREERLTRHMVRVGDAVGAFIEYWGFKAIHGRVWTLLLLRAQPTPQTEIARALGVSRSLISGAVSELMDHGLVRPVGEHRNAPYEAVIDVWPTISDVLRSREWMLVEAARLALEAAIEEVEYARSVGHEVHYDLDRMRMLLAMTELAQALLRILMSLRMPRSTERFGTWLKKAAGLAGRLRGMV